MAESFQLFKTPSPREPGVRTELPIRDLTPDMIPVLGTAIADCDELIRRRIPQAWWSYAFCEYDTSNSGFAAFKFCKVKTDADLLVPFESFETNTEYSWPNVLINLNFVEDNAFPLSTAYANSSGGTVFAPRIYARMSIRPGATFESLTEIRRYASDWRPFDKETLQHQEPVPTTVQWDFNGAQGSLTCLHKKLSIPARGRHYTLSSGGSLSEVGAPVLPELKFPATNYDDWAPFFLSKKQSQVDGIFYLETQKIYPTSIQEIIRL